MINIRSLAKKITIKVFEFAAALVVSIYNIRKWPIIHLIYWKFSAIQRFCCALFYHRDMNISERWNYFEIIYVVLNIRCVNMIFPCIEIHELEQSFLWNSSGNFKFSVFFSQTNLFVYFPFFVIDIHII